MSDEELLACFKVELSELVAKYGMLMYAEGNEIQYELIAVEDLRG